MSDEGENNSFEEIKNEDSDNEKIREANDENIMETNDEEISVFIKQITGDSTLIKCSPTANILKLKELISKKLNINANSQRLMYLNKQLEDDKTLDYYDIQSNSTIHLILRLHGGLN